MSIARALLVLAPRSSIREQRAGARPAFFTPEQRQALDARRKARADKPAATIVVSPTTRVDGFVKRSGGPSTVWVNGEALPEGSGDAPRIAPSLSVTVGEGGRRTALKPGEVLDRDTGEIRDVIGGGEIRVRRTPNEASQPRFQPGRTFGRGAHHRHHHDDGNRRLDRQPREPSTFRDRATASCDQGSVDRVPAAQQPPPCPDNDFTAPDGVEIGQHPATPRLRAAQRLASCLT